MFSTDINLFTAEARIWKSNMDVDIKEQNVWIVDCCCCRRNCSVKIVMQMEIYRRWIVVIVNKWDRVAYQDI